MAWEQLSPNLQVRGLRKFTRALNRLGVDGKLIARDSANEIIDKIKEESQIEVPVSVDGSHGGEPGALKASVQVFKQNALSENNYFAQITYGNESVFYAQAVHEIIGPKHNSPTKAKYLEDPTNRLAPNLPLQIKTKLELLAKKLQAGAD